MKCNLIFNKFNVAKIIIETPRKICINRIWNIDLLAFKIILSLIIRRKYSSIFSSPAVRKENVHNFAKRIILCTWLHIIRYATNIDTYMSYKSWQHGARNEVIFTFQRMADNRELLAEIKLRLHFKKCLNMTSGHNNYKIIYNLHECN